MEDQCSRTLNSLLNILVIGDISLQKMPTEVRFLQ